MFVYADTANKTCEIIKSNDVLDAIAISKGKGIIYLTKDEDESEDITGLSNEEIIDLMNRSIAWKDGILTKLGKNLIDNSNYSNFRNYID